MNKNNKKDSKKKVWDNHYTTLQKLNEISAFLSEPLDSEGGLPVPIVVTDFPLWKLLSFSSYQNQIHLPIQFSLNLHITHSFTSLVGHLKY